MQGLFFGIIAGGGKYKLVAHFSTRYTSLQELMEKSISKEEYTITEVGKEL